MPRTRPASPSPDRPFWRMPITPDAYDPDPVLSPSERHALSVTQACQADHLPGWAPAMRAAGQALARLEQPVYAVVALRHPRDPGHIWDHVRMLMRRATRRYERPFWAWSRAEWLDVVCPTGAAFKARYGAQTKGRASLLDVAYLLCDRTDLYRACHDIHLIPAARAYFGPALLEHALGRLAPAVVGPTGLGYSGTDACLLQLRSTLSLLLILNRSPYLEDLTLPFLQTAGAEQTKNHASGIRHIMVGLHRLGLIPPPEADGRVGRTRAYDLEGVAPAWAEWCLAWGAHAQAVSAGLQHQTVNTMLGVGRWLAEQHPAVTVPEQWDEELALDYVDAVCHMTVGAYASAHGRLVLTAKGQAPTPLTPKGIDSKLGNVRRFFSDLQDRPHAVGGRPARRIALHFKPAQAFETPAAVRRLIQPDPRDIDQALWYKLVYAAATLTQDDLPRATRYPLAFYRALGLIWVSTGRRSDEIARLRVGCVRREWDAAMLSEDGRPVEDGTQGNTAPLCYLHVPSGKWRGPFWIWIPAYVADAIETWQAERPVHQPALLDRKDGRLVEYLFCLRGVHMDRAFINKGLIPVLFKKAVGDQTLSRADVRDAKGQITSHRARSTRATILRLLGVSLDDIAEYLGHADSKTVTHYARTNPLQLAQRIRKASELERIVEGVIDLQAAAAGRPSVRWWLGWDADGAPRYCGHPAWFSCAHRLECQKCGAFIGGTAARLLQENTAVIPIQARVPMTPLEVAASDGDARLFDALLTELKDVPPPPVAPDSVFNQDAPPSPASATQRDEVACLSRERARLQESLAEALAAPARKGILIKALRAKITAVDEALAARRTIPAEEQNP